MAESITLSNLELTRFFFALVSLLAAAHLCGYVFQRLGLPRVVGEICGGMMLGPSVLGHWAPGATQWLFHAFPSEGKLLSAIYWLGLTLLMFVSGFEIQKSTSRADRTCILALVAGSTLIPLCAGWFAPHFFDFSPYLGTAQHLPALRIVIAIAAAVTSIPVISKIFLDLHLMDTRFATIVLATATIHDVILWVLLAIATGLVSGSAPELSDIAMTVAVTILFFALSLRILPRVLQRTNRLRYNLFIKSSVSGYVLCICLLFSAIASLLDVNLVFGALLAGVVIGLMPTAEFAVVKSHIKEMAMAFFVPVYFAIVGLKLDLVHHLEWPLLAGLLLFTTGWAVLGTVVTARALRLPWRTCANFGVAMSTRGGPGIVLATVALDLGIINQTLFVTLVLIAVLTSLAAGAWFRLVQARGWPLMQEPPESPCLPVRAAT